MFLRPSYAFSLKAKQIDDRCVLVSPTVGGLSASISALPLSPRRQRRNTSLVVSAAAETNLPLTGVVFQPFEEVKKEAFMVPFSSQVSLARQSYCDESESAINEQIKSVDIVFLPYYNFLGSLLLLLLLTCCLLCLFCLFLCNSVEYNASYVYHALFAYFDRDNIALRGLAK